MVETNNSQENEVKVEDLLRLKRAEQPNEAFWNTFDRELHQRMLQTLVKKDPWYVQVLRSVSGRIAQTAAVGSAAAFLAVMVVRPAFVDSGEHSQSPAFAQQDVEIVSSALFEVAMSDLDETLTPDYQIEAISSANSGSSLGYTKDYSHDTFEVAAYDSNAYAMDSALFAETSMATALVY